MEVGSEGHQIFELEGGVNDIYCPGCQGSQAFSARPSCKGKL
jgi:hypothetical protein